MRKRLDQKGYISTNEYKMEEKEIMKQKLKSNLLKKDQFDRKKVDITDGGLSLNQFMSTKKRIENMTKDYMVDCKGAHPAYVQGYNPRHFNYLKNSGFYTNKNPLNIH